MQIALFLLLNFDGCGQQRGRGYCFSSVKFHHDLLEDWTGVMSLSVYVTYEPDGSPPAPARGDRRLNLMVRLASYETLKSMWAYLIALTERLAQLW